MTAVPTTPAQESDTIRKIVAVLDKVDPEAQDRIATWIADRYPTETSQEQA